MTDKTLENVELEGARKNVKDAVFWGYGDMFKLMSKAYSVEEGWMKSTKGMETGNGVVVQVTTQQKNIDGTYSIAEAVTFVPNVFLNEVRDKKTDQIIGRFISDVQEDPWGVE